MRHFILLLLALAAVARAGPVLVVRARDARTGRPLADARCALAAARTGRVYARFGGSHAGRTPGAGDTLFVYRRGYDLWTASVDAGSEVVDAPLAPARDACTLVLRDPGASPTARVAVSVRDGVVRDSFELTLREPRTRLVLPRGTKTSLLLTVRDGIVWPVTLVARPGATYALEVDRPRLLDVRRDPVALPVRALEAVPDTLWIPRVSPARIDAWRWHLNRNAWLRAELLAARPRLRLLPDVPFHLFAVAGDVALYRHVPAGAPVLDLRGPFRLRQVRWRPLVNGREARDGSILAPGRLDLYAVATVAQLARRLPGCCHTLGAGPWRPVSLPASKWLTVWHPDVGLAHLPWREDARAAGDVGPGRLTVAVPAGWSARGYVSLFPVWRGAGRVKTLPPDRLLRRTLDGRRRTKFRGLAPGWYGLDTRVSLFRAGRVVRLRRTREVLVPARRALTLTLRPR